MIDECDCKSPITRGFLLAYTSPELLADKLCPQCGAEVGKELIEQARLDELWFNETDQ